MNLTDQFNAATKVIAEGATTREDVISQLKERGVVVEDNQLGKFIDELLALPSKEKGRENGAARYGSVHNALSASGLMELGKAKRR